MKKVFYIFLWVVLGLILSFILHGVIEIIYLHWAEKNNVVVNWILGGSCTLPLWLVVLLPVVFTILSVWCGLVAWRKIYIISNFGKVL